MTLKTVMSPCLCSLKTHLMLFFSQIRSWIFSKEQQVRQQIQQHSSTNTGSKSRQKYNVLPQSVHDVMLHND